MVWSSDETASLDTQPVISHLAARIEDWFHRLRERWGRRRGLTASIVPFVGYGSTKWVRVLCRVQLTRVGAKARQPLGNARGWRSFVGIPVAHALVRIEAAGTVREVHSDRGGVVDLRVDVALPPGWHEIEISVE